MIPIPALLLVRPWLKYLAVAIAVLAAVWAWNRWLDGRDEAAFERGQIAGRAEVQGRWDKAENQRREVADKAEKDSRARERSMQEKANVAIAKSNQRVQVARAAAADARTELDRLRNVPIPATKPDSGGSAEAACRAADDRTRAVRELFSACSAEYEDVARAAGGHLRDALSAREAWPTGESK